MKESQLSFARSTMEMSNQSFRSAYFPQDQEITKIQKDLQTPESFNVNYLEKITFSPIFQDEIKSKYKDFRLTLNTQDFLPKISVGHSILKKIFKDSTSARNREAMLYFTSYELNSVSTYLQEKIYKCDEICYSTDEYDSFKIAMKYYLYNLLVEDDVEQLQFGVESIENTMNEAIKCLPSYTGLDFSGGSQYQNENINYQGNSSLQKSLKNIDLLYLNMFRIFLIFVKDSRNHQDEHQYKIIKYLHFPKIQFTLNMISQPYKIVSTPLTKILTKKNQQNSESKKKIYFKFGFLTLDQNKRLLPLLTSDPLTEQVPLIGVWTHGLNLRQFESRGNIEDNMNLITILSEFIRNRNLSKKCTINTNNNSFLLITFQSEETTTFYEVESDETESKYSILNQEEKISQKEFEKMSVLNQDFFYSSHLEVNKISFSESFLNWNKIKNHSKTSSVATKKNSVSKESNYSIYSQEEEDHSDTLIYHVPKPFQLEDNNTSQVFYGKTLNNNHKTQKNNKKKIPKFAEMLIIQQAEQLKLLQQQILDLQNTLNQQKFYSHPAKNDYYSQFGYDNRVMFENGLHNFQGSVYQNEQQNQNQKQMPFRDITNQELNKQNMNYNNNTNNDNSKENCKIQKTYCTKSINTTFSLFEEQVNVDKNFNELTNKIENLIQNQQEYQQNNKICGSQCLNPIQDPNQHSQENYQENYFQEESVPCNLENEQLNDNLNNNENIELQTQIPSNNIIKDIYEKISLNEHCSSQSNRSIQVPRVTFMYGKKIESDDSEDDEIKSIESKYFKGNSKVNF